MVGTSAKLQPDPKKVQGIVSELNKAQPEGEVDSSAYVQDILNLSVDLDPPEEGVSAGDRGAA